MSTVILERKEDPDFSVEVKVSDVSVADLYAVNALAASIPRSLEEFQRLAGAFEPYLIAWSYPEEANAAGLAAREWPMVKAIVSGWIEGVILAPPPLLQRSFDGGPSPSEDPR